ncbi:hypothetical protein EON77_22035 [bacterium]|nr:MAG: hypothetical protein EON77_22035 [bacterium]
MRPTPVKRLAIAALAIAAAAVSTPFVSAQEKNLERQNKEIYQQLAKALNDLVDDDGADGLGERLNASDRRRVEEDLKKTDGGEYAKLVKDFKKRWKDKYKADYNPESRLNVIDNNPVERFEYEGVKYATVKFAALGGDDPFEIRMAQQKDTGNWRIQLNDKLTGQRLVRRLEYSFEDLNGQIDSWKSDPAGLTEAYTVANRRLLGVFDYDPQQKKKTDDDDKKAAKKRK